MSKTAHELTRKEMKGPDRFQVAAADAASWMAKYQKQLGVAAIAVVVLAVVAAVASYMLDARRASSGGLLYRAIDAAGAEVSSIPLPNFDRPIYKTVEEKERAVIDAASKVRERAGGTRAAATATLLEADAHLDPLAHEAGVDRVVVGVDPHVVVPGQTDPVMPAQR